MVINTCGFIGDAKQESIDMILRAAAAKQAGKIDRLFVIGCLSERYADELRAELPRSTTTSAPARGTASSGRWAPPGDRRWPPNVTSDAAPLRLFQDFGGVQLALRLLRHSAHPRTARLRADGELRGGGPQTRRRKACELIVIAQDTTYYGIDLYGHRRLAELLRRLCRIDGIEWIRLHYAYPAGFPEEVIEVMASEPKICKYLDIPFQHISDRQLTAMDPPHQGRGAGADRAAARGAFPNIALRTTLLVGYPGETEEDFAELMQFVRDVRFERLGVFAYSEEEGTCSGARAGTTTSPTRSSSSAWSASWSSSTRSRSRTTCAAWAVSSASSLTRAGDFYVGRTQYDSPRWTRRF